jgi:hypothetical protein
MEQLCPVAEPPKETLFFPDALAEVPTATALAPLTVLLVPNAAEFVPVTRLLEPTLRPPLITCCAEDILQPSPREKRMMKIVNLYLVLPCTSCLRGLFRLRDAALFP